jgi:hypothetical protein
MATNIDEVISFLSDEGLRYSHSEGNDYLRTGFAMKKYVDVDGDKLLHIVISVEEQGKFLKIAAPCAYRFHHDGTSFHKLALFQTLLQICHMTKMVQFEYDPDEGEIQAIVEFALEALAFERLLHDDRRAPRVLFGEQLCRRRGKRRPPIVRRIRCSHARLPVRRQQRALR